MPLPQESWEAIQCKYAPRKFFTDAPKKYRLEENEKKMQFYLYLLVINLLNVSTISFLVAITHESIVMYLLLDFAAVVSTASICGYLAASSAATSIMESFFTFPVFRS